MKWIHHFDLFLFDFDGLLVNTEHIHFQAYINMLDCQGIRLDWSFAKYCALAHLNADALRERLYLEFPHLDPNWKPLYEEKKKAYKELLTSGNIELMPGAKELLAALEKGTIRRCVVTHSPLEQIALIRSRSPLLQSIPNWITREDYLKPKPHPEGYLRAIELHGKKGDRIIGFEDSLRGLEALKQTPALPILVCPSDHPLLETAAKPQCGPKFANQTIHVESLEMLDDSILFKRSEI